MAGKQMAPTYGEAVTELEKIISEIEEESIDVDALTEKVKRATYLIGLCKEKLSSTEVEVKKALEGLEEEPEEDGDDPF